MAQPAGNRGDDVESESDGTVSDSNSDDIVGSEEWDVSLDNVNIVHPAVVNSPPAPAVQRQPKLPLPTTDMARLNEKDCKDAMTHHVESRCCYGDRPARELKITKIVGMTALHITLKSFNEKRWTKEKEEPYRGKYSDYRSDESPPKIWDIDVSPNPLFSEHKIKQEVPNSSKIKECSSCDGRGKNDCWTCNRTGYVPCTSCDSDTRNCSSCNGKREYRCSECSGNGTTTCWQCSGYGKLRRYLQLNCEFVNHFDQYVLNPTDMKNSRVARASGTILFKDVQTKVPPLKSYPVPEVNVCSSRLIEAHKWNWPGEVTRKQRQTLRAVPVTEVAYEWDEIKTRFWVYGNKRKVYAPDYPHQCCCGRCYNCCRCCCCSII